MARPKPDEALIRKQLLETAESLLSHHGAGKVTVTDIAAACGMSQSNAYRYFPSKASLMAALAERWFAETEEAAGDILAQEAAPRDKIRALLLATFQLKRARLDADPALFTAFLQLGAANPQHVAAHAGARYARFRQLVRAHLAERGHSLSHADRLTQTLLDATLLIRDPNLILQYRADLSDERAERLVDFAVGLLDAH